LLGHLKSLGPQELAHLLKSPISRPIENNFQFQLSVISTYCQVIFGAENWRLNYRNQLNHNNKGRQTATFIIGD
jgi:hypothetical protein